MLPMDRPADLPRRAALAHAKEHVDARQFLPSLPSPRRIGIIVGLVAIVGRLLLQSPIPAAASPADRFVDNLKMMLPIGLGFSQWVPYSSIDHEASGHNPLSLLTTSSIGYHSTQDDSEVSRARVEWTVEGDQSVIYVVMTDGERRKVVSESFERMLLPQFGAFITLSPDDKTVSYVTADNEMLTEAQIWLVNSDSTQQRLLAQFENDFWIAPLVWSPDSKHLAFTRVTHPPAEPGIELWIVDTITAVQTHVIDTPGLKPEMFYGSHPPVLRWSADGIEYTDYGSLNTARITHIVDPHLVKPTYQRETMFSDLNSAQATLPCGVSLFSQNDTQWRNAIMQTCGTTIGSQGCALRNPMAFRYFSVDTQPATLNSCLGNMPVHLTGEQRLRRAVKGRRVSRALAAARSGFRGARLNQLSTLDGP